VTILQPVQALGCGCDAVPGALISIDAAFERISRFTGPVTRSETLPLSQCRGRVLAQSVRAQSAVPPFDNAAMDGYAIATADLQGPGPWVLPVQGRIAAGQAGMPRPAQGTATQIFTGAPIPAGTDAVVMQEHVVRVGDTIRIDRAVPGHAHVRFAGEDMKAGRTILPEGRLLTARDIAACAAAGANMLNLRGPVRVALLVTGDEVTQPGRPLASAGICDVNTPMLSAAIEATGATLGAAHVGTDSREAMRARLAELAQIADLVITTGGISVGEEDHVKPALSDLGAQIAFSGVAMKPGKPVSFGRIGHARWLGLPGNPLSAFVTWALFGPAILAALTGRTGWQTRRRTVVTGDPVHRKPGRCELRLARIEGMDGQGREVVRFNDATHSGRVSTLPFADGMIFLPAETDRLPVGALVEFQPFCDFEGAS
jgi:molybdopterin molybdotransferase